MNHDLIDGSIISTPKPAASSTVEKKHLIRNIAKKLEPIPLNYSTTSEAPTNESLGILSLNEVDLTPQLEKPVRVDVDPFTRLKQQRILAQNTLHKVKATGLPSRFLVPSDSYTSVAENNVRCHSTVNESDLLKRTTKNSSFSPNNVSTPRNSKVECPNVYDNMSEISEKIRNSDVSLKDLFSQLGKFSLSRLSTAAEESDSRMFTPAELAQEKLLRDELSWRKERDIPTENFRKESILCANSTAFDEKFSVGDFFRCKSEEVTDTFFKTSPKRKDPVPLIDVTNSIRELCDESGSRSRVSDVIPSNVQNESLVSVSHIAKILASADSADTPTKVVHYLMTKGFKSKKKLQCDEAKNTSLSNRNDRNDKLSIDCLIPQRESENSITSLDLQRFNDRNTESHFLHTNTYHGVESSEYRAHQSSEPQLYRRQSENVTKLQKLQKTDFKRHENFSRDLDKCGQDFQLFGNEICGNNEIALKELSVNSLSLRDDFDVTSDRPKLSNVVVSRKDDFAKEIAKGNKENVSEIDRSMISTRSGSSLDTLPDGKFPIKSTRTELVWGCMKLGRTNTQEFFIRNQLNQRIRLQASVTGNSFRILKDRGDSDMLTSMNFLLHPMETKSFYVTFCPTILGARCEKLNFYPIINGEVQYNKRQILALYGYGGHSSLDIIDVPKDSGGKLWLSLGKLDHKTVVTQKFTIKNSGTLSGFACLDIGSKGLYAFSVLYVQPNEFVLKPQEKVIVTITYTPAKQDFRNLSNTEVVEIGFLKIIYGAEALRGRLKRLCAKLKQTGGNADPLLERLCKSYSDERMPTDLRLFKESVGATKELLQQLIFKEITITLEQDLDRTLIGQIEVDETSMYQTLGPDVPDASVVEDVTIRRVNDCEFKVEPTSVILTPPLKVQDTILLHSESARAVPFEITVEPGSMFLVEPTKGVVSPGEMMVIKVGCVLPAATRKAAGKISIVLENEVIEVCVKCIVVKSR